MKRHATVTKTLVEEDAEDKKSTRLTTVKIAGQEKRWNGFSLRKCVMRTNENVGGSLHTAFH